MTQYSDLRKSIFSGNVQAPIRSPLSTNQYPSAMPSHNSGVLQGRHPNPPSFYPSSNDSVVANSRYQYVHTSSSLNTPYATSINKYNQPMPSSMRTSQIRSNAVGKSGYKVGLPNNAPLSYKSYFPTDVYTHKRFVRSGGSVAPKKKGSIYNDSLRTVCGWGSIVRSTY